ncbi:MAG: ABC transporter ATP-binding protein [Bacteroidales bacterium]|nr:ABC transporter ATP-binding protein [Bacteroidales bacterium]
MINSICIKTENLSKRYRNSEEESLSKISFTINKGDKFGILGPNGAGKTTLISILCGIIPTSSGKYSYYENDTVLSLVDIKKRLGFVPQDYAFYEELSPIQNMMYFGSFYKLSIKEITRRSEEIFNILGISNVAHKKIKTFSGGMKRRMNLAIGIIHKPAVLFLDEPTVGADVQSKHAMLTYINFLNSEGTTVVYTSHHMSEAQEFCNRIVLINKGELVVCDELKPLLQKYNTSSLKSLFIQLTGTQYFDHYE